MSECKSWIWVLFICQLFLGQEPQNSSGTLVGKSRSLPLLPHLACTIQRQLWATFWNLALQTQKIELNVFAVWALLPIFKIRRAQTLCWTTIHHSISLPSCFFNYGCTASFHGSFSAYFLSREISQGNEESRKGEKKRHSTEHSSAWKGEKEEENLGKGMRLNNAVGKRNATAGFARWERNIPANCKLAPKDHSWRN